MTALEIAFVVFRIRYFGGQSLVPAVGDRGEPRVERLAQRRYQVGQRISEILVLAAAEAMPSHHHAAAEQRVRSIARGQRRTFIAVQKRSGSRASMSIDLCSQAAPIEVGNSRFQPRARGTNSFQHVSWPVDGACDPG